MPKSHKNTTDPVVITIVVILAFFLLGFLGMGSMMGSGWGFMPHMGYNSGGVNYSYGLFGGLFQLLSLTALVLLIVWLVKKIKE